MSSLMFDYEPYAWECLLEDVTTKLYRWMRWQQWVMMMMTMVAAAQEAAEPPTQYVVRQESRPNSMYNWTICRLGVCRA